MAVPVPVRVGIAEHRVDHRGALEVVADLVLHCHADTAMQLDRLLADQPAGAADLHLCGRQRVAPFDGILLRRHHRREHRHATCLLQGDQHVDSTVLEDLKAADLAAELPARLQIVHGQLVHRRHRAHRLGTECRDRLIDDALDERQRRTGFAEHTINTSPTDFAPIKQIQMARFDGERWQLFGPLISGKVVG
jgi:hypothetical protein